MNFLSTIFDLFQTPVLFDETDMPRFNQKMIGNINSTLTYGCFFAAIFGMGSSLLIVIGEYFGLSKGMLIPGIWSFICGFLTFIVFLLASEKMVKGKILYLVSALFTTLPTIIYLLSYAYLPSGSATYITGPPSYLYFFMIMLTGFTFDFKISVGSGFLAGLQYLFVFFVSHEQLEIINCPDRLMYQDITGLQMYFFKALMMVVMGFTVGVLSNNSRKLLSEILREENDKQAIDKMFGQYVSSEVKDKIMTEKRDIIGERKNVTVLFSDIRSFTTLSEKRSPEALVLQLNEYFDRMVNCINAEGGVIDKFIGDAVMANFGGVLALDNPCDSALKAAISMQKSLADLNEDWKKRDIPQLKNGIGIHFGDVIQGTLGSKSRKEFTVIGDAVNTASRLESICKEVKSVIVVSEMVHEKLSPEMRALTSPLGDVALKGKTNKVSIFGFPTEMDFSKLPDLSHIKPVQNQK